VSKFTLRLDQVWPQLFRDHTVTKEARNARAAGAGLRSLAEPVVDTTFDFAELVGVAAKLERRRIMERTARGRADAKAKGVTFGRKPSLTSHQQKEVHQRIDAGETQRSVARSYNVSQATISRLSFS
jgi:DNA invertase Pin-like site-specific DNA recombinase